MSCKSSTGHVLVISRMLIGGLSSFVDLTCVKPSTLDSRALVKHHGAQFLNTFILLKLGWKLQLVRYTVRARAQQSAKLIIAALVVLRCGDAVNPRSSATANALTASAGAQA